MVRTELTGQDRHVRNGIDLTKVEGNPSHTFQEMYPLLMEIADPAELAHEVRALVAPLVGNGVSVANHRKMLAALAECQASAAPLDELRHYVTGYVLAGAGLRAMPTRYGRKSR